MQFTGENLFTDINFMIREKDRIGLVGKNGAGKTTLIRLLCGLEQPYKGDVIMSDDVTIGYLPQEKNVHSTKTVLDEAMTAFEEYYEIERQLAKLQDELSNREDYESASYQRLCEKMSHLNERLALMGGHSIEGEAEQILIGLGFEHNDMQRPMKEFSNGWQMRVELAKILLRKPKLLLLDEPTNHLDAESIDWLEQHLQQYEGTVICITHDRYFLDNIAGWILELDRGEGIPWKGNYSSWLEQKTKRMEQEEKIDSKRRKTL